MVLGHGRPQPCRGEIPHVRDPSGNTPRFFHPPFFLHTFPQILPTNTSDGASRQLLNRPHLRVWHHGGRRAEAEGFTRSSRGDHLSDPRAAGATRGRGGDGADGAVLVATRTPGRNVPYSAGDASRRAEDSCPQSCRFSPLASALAQVTPSTALLLLQVRSARRPLELVQ